MLVTAMCGPCGRDMLAHFFSIDIWVGNLFQILTIHDLHGGRELLVSTSKLCLPIDL